MPSLSLFGSHSPSLCLISNIQDPSKYPASNVCPYHHVCMHMKCTISANQTFLWILTPTGRLCHVAPTEQLTIPRVVQAVDSGLNSALTGWTPRHHAAEMEDTKVCPKVGYIGVLNSIQWLRTKNCAAVPINIAIYGIFSASITNSSAKLPKILNGHMQRLYDALCLICLIHQNVVNSLNSPYFWTTWAIQPMWWSHLKASRPLALVEPTAAATSGVLPGGWVDVTFFQLAVGWCDFCPTDVT